MQVTSIDSDRSPQRRGAGPAVKASGYLLSLLSPVWRAKLCGHIGTEARRQLALDESEARLFSKLVALGSGASVRMEGGLREAVGLGLMADRYQVEVVQDAVEDAVMRLVTVESCGRVLEWSSGSGLVRVERASREVALRSFDAFAATVGFMEVGEEVLGSLLDDDGLVTEREERVLEAVVRWMQGGDGGGRRSAGLVGKVRFPLMEASYLADLSSKGWGKDVGLDGLLSDAISLLAQPLNVGGGQGLGYLDGRATVARCGVRWEEYVRGGERKLDAGRAVFSLAADGDRLCAGLSIGSIGVWSRSTLELKRTLTGHIVHRKGAGVCRGAAGQRVFRPRRQGVGCGRWAMRERAGGP